MRLLLWSLLRLLIVLPLVAIGILFLVLGLALSPWGAGLLLEEGAKRGFYQLERVEGAPLDRLVLHGFQIEAGPADIAAERFELIWADDCLLRGRLCIERLAMQGGRVALRPGQPEEEPAAAPAPDETGASDPIRLPFPMEVRELVLVDTKVSLADGTHVALAQLNTAAMAENSGLQLGASRAEGLNVTLPANAEANVEANANANAEAVVERADEVAAETAQPPFRFPLDIAAPELVIEDVALRLGDGTQVGWSRLHTGIEAEGERLTLLPTRLERLQVSLPAGGAEQLALEAPAGTPALSAQALAAAETVGSAPVPTEAGEPEVPLAQRERIVLPEIVLPLTIAAPRIHLDGVELRGPLDYDLRHLTLAFEASDQVVEIVALEAASLDADVRLGARIELRDDYPLQARLEAALWLPELMPELAGQRLDLRLDGTLAELDAELVARGPVSTRLTAQVDVLDPEVPFSARMRSEFLQWPLPMAAAFAEEDEALDDPYVIEDLDLRLSGTLEQYSAALSARVEGPEVPLTRIALTGSGDLEHFAWTPLSLSLGNASVVSRGRIEWHDGLALDATVRLDNLDPGQFTDAMQGRLSGNMDLAFSQTEAGWQLRVPRLAIDGQLQELPLSLRARLAGDSDMRWQVQEFDFRQGQNRITAAGAITEQRMDLSGDISLTELDSLHDDLSGSLTGRFRTAGTLGSPRLELDLRGQTLAFAENRLEALQLTASVQGLDDPSLDGNLAIERLNAGGQRFSEVSLALSGRLSAHRAELTALAGRGMPLSRASLALEGGLSTERQRYSGRIDPLEVDTDYGEMRLDDPVTFTFDLATARAQVQPFCLRREQGGRLCLEDALQAGADQGQVSLAVRELPMSMFNEWLPEDWRASGETDLQLQARWRQGGRQWSAEADLDSQLDLEGVDIYGQPWSMPATRLAVRLDATQARMALDLELGLGDAGRLALDLDLNDPLGSGELAGSLVVDALDLSRYRTLAVGLDMLEGTLAGRVGISGSRDNPSLDGALELMGLRASGLDVPLIVEDGRIRIEFNGDSARLMGYVASDDGRLVIDGNASWPSLDEWRIAVELDGTRRPLLVSLPQFGRLRVAPEIAVRVTPQALRVRGDVRVPWARLEVGEAPPAAVSPSPDEVIITRRDEARVQRREELEPTAGGDEAAAVALREAGMQLDVRIELHLGPDMTLAASGLETGLAGTLQVRQQDGPVQLFGEVNLVDGRFRAFGQDLLIRQGQLLFSGPPEQPLLDFEAIRNPDITEDGVIAGLRVTGFAAEPSLAIFSEPAMDEARALSYLLRGRAPRDGDADGALTSALVGLALGQTGGVVGAIGQAFGIDDLALETTGVGDDSQVVVSGYLTEDLRVSYGVGIFSPIAELTLRYTLWRNLYVQAVSGAAQAVDLVYIFSRPGRPPRLEPAP
ncbi:translocation/assembly module TamB [Halomonas daqingensis]|uniref:Translocation/assembly module TamB n=1 Tax=Billgrantia desiderata TaxID=52021 RepID=A0AAW4YQA9_9GAMM|nr:translocation/assembly module TamB domain-containing protein [Halomonas desiderata]MCE8050872.1 translocation/assembly module TamB [Halomonas desiderata]